ncbi:helix-turn-helix transcriptional regulator [Glaciecola siphonariae]|uniref:Helix-turn-helix transcriptional regulator n=1 Tax=Glaciecola siphonariae TaxID=521012 RepID=A0ABV9LT31_9ALTE
MRTLRLFQILDFLRARSQPVSSVKLSDALGVSQRTIYRDIATLMAIGAPIQGEPGIGYQLQSGFFLPPLDFTEDELDALVMGMRLLMSRSDKTTQEAAERVLGKVNSISTSNTHLIERPLLAVGKHDSTSWFNAEAIGMLRHAIQKRAVLKIEYIDLNNSMSERHIRSVGLTIFESSWLLTAWCELRQDFRNFRVDRIAKIEDVNRRFRLEKGKRFSDYLDKLVSAE